MTKSNKSTSMIRRRKNKQASEFISRVRKSQLPSTTQLDVHDNINEESFFHKQNLGSSVIATIMSSDKTIFLGLVVIRLVNSLLMQTAFVPDEFWQSMEVAHNMVFGYGHLTWEWRAGIRSYLHPLMVAVLYKTLALLGLDHRTLLIRTPRLLQSVVAAVGDMYLYRLSGRLAGGEVARWTLLCQLLSWFTAYCCTRTLSNGLEATLVTAALYHYPWPGCSQPAGYSRRYVALAALSVMVRPTAAVLWLLLAAWHLQHCKGTALWSALKVYFTTGLAVVGVSTAVDRVWYGRWVLVHYNFLYFNVFSGNSALYGRHPWHWYLSQGLPVTLGPHLLPFALGAWASPNRLLLMLILWQVFVLSLVAHKEFRFLLPVLPLAMHYCGLYFHSASQTPPLPPPPDTTGKEVKGQGEEGKVGHGDSNAESPVLRKGTNDDLRNRANREVRKGRAEDGDGGGPVLDVLFSSVSDQETGSQAFPPKDQEDGNDTASLLTTHDEGKDLKPKEQRAGKGEEGKEVAGRGRGRGFKVRCLVLALALTNLPPLLYFSLIHQRGTLDVMNFLHQSVQRGRRENDVDVLFLMPCHSTPLYSHLHTNVSLTFLTCEPNLDHARNYTEMAELFYRDPLSWLEQRYSGLPLPSHVVYFDALVDDVSVFLQEGGYRLCAQFFHTHFPEGRVGSYVLVSCR